MNRIGVVLATLTLLIPLRAWSQDTGGLGLDLTDDAQKKDEKKEEPNAKTPPTPAAVTPPTPAASDPGRQDVSQTEREITQEDRVKSVQRKLYLKKNRFELAPFIMACVNDPFFVRYGPSVRLSYFLADTFAISVRGAYWVNALTDDRRIAARTYQSRIFFSQPIWSAIGDMEWSPLYGKVTIFNSILHFDMYLIGGVGVVVTNTSVSQSNQQSGTGTDSTIRQQLTGGRPGGDLGGGLRFVIKDYLAANVALINTTYLDTPLGTTKGSTQNLVTLNAGVSIFFPFSSTGKEAE